jgi:large subunit ribosomal protein L4
VLVVDDWGFGAPSTKEAQSALIALGLEGKVLVVLGDDDVVAHKSFRNLPEVQTIRARELNAYDVLVNDWVVFTQATLPGADAEEATEK